MRPAPWLDVRLVAAAGAAALAQIMAGCVQNGHYGSRGEWISRPGLALEHDRLPDPIGEGLSWTAAVASIFTHGDVLWRGGLDSETLARIEHGSWAYERRE